MAADKIHDDVVQLKSEMSKTLTEVREQNTNLASFLSEMTQEVEVMVARTAKIEICSEPEWRRTSRLAGTCRNCEDVPCSVPREREAPRC